MDRIRRIQEKLKNKPAAPRAKDDEGMRFWMVFLLDLVMKVHPQRFYFKVSLPFRCSLYQCFYRGIYRRGSGEDPED